MKLKFALVFITLLFFGCGEKAVDNPEDDKAAVISQIERFHKLYNDQDFEQIADEIYDPEFLDWKEKDITIRQYENFYQKYGKLMSVNSISKMQYYSVGNGVPFEQSRYIAAFYELNYENGIKFNEMFILSLPGEPKITTHRIHDNNDKIVVWD